MDYWLRLVFEAFTGAMSSLLQGFFAALFGLT